MRKYLIVLALVIGLLIGYFFRDYQYKQEMKKADDYVKSLNLDKQNSQNDPLNLFGSPNPALDDCFKKVNPNDPLGVGSESESQKTQREECINKYGNK